MSLQTDKVPTLMKLFVEQENNEDEEQKAVANILMIKCCNNCLLNLTGYIVLTSRRKVCCLQGSKCRQWIIDRLSETSCYINGKLKTKFNVGGIDVRRLEQSFYKLFKKNKLSELLKLTANFLGGTPSTKQQFARGKLSSLCTSNFLNLSCNCKFFSFISSFCHLSISSNYHFKTVILLW